MKVLYNLVRIIEKEKDFTCLWYSALSTLIEVSYIMVAPPLSKRLEVASFIVKSLSIQFTVDLRFAQEDRILCMIPYSNYSILIAMVFPEKIEALTRLRAKFLWDTSVPFPKILIL